jgi:O-antigen ligase
VSGVASSEATQSSAVPAGEAELAARRLLAVVAAIGVIAGVLGLTSRVVFSQPSLLKYAITVVAPLAVLLIAGMRRPFVPIVVLTLLASPFAFVTSFQGVALSPVGILLALAVVVLLFMRPQASVPSVVGVGAPICLGCLAPAVARSSSPWHYALTIVGITLVAVVSRRAGLTHTGLVVLLGALVVAASGQAAIAIWETVTHHQLDLYNATGSTGFGSDYFFSFGGENRPAAALPDPISLGNVLAISLPVDLSLMFCARSYNARAAWLILGVVIAVALAMTLSRMSWVGGAAGVIVLIMLLPGRRLRNAAIVSIVALLIVAVALAIGGSALRQRFTSVSSPTSRTTGSAAEDRQRENIWRAALDVSADHPVLGTGLGRINAPLSRYVGDISAATHAHSTYLQVLAETGAVGAIGVLLLLMAAGADLIAGKPHEPVIAAGLLAGFAAMLICWTTDYTIRYLQVAVFAAVLLGATSAIGTRWAGDEQHA